MAATVFAEATGSSAIILPVSHTAAALNFIVWIAVSVALAARYLLCQGPARKLVFHTICCFLNSCLWVVFALSPRLNTLYVGSRKPAFDTALISATLNLKQVWGRFRTITCLEDRTTKKRGYAEPTRICT
jgi:hypothetical protein